MPFFLPFEKQLHSKRSLRGNTLPTQLFCLCFFVYYNEDLHLDKITKNVEAALSCLKINYSTVSNTKLLFFLLHIKTTITANVSLKKLNQLWHSDKERSQMI